MRETHLIMGVLNVTPDSFSDGGRYVDPGLAYARMETMVAEGADIVDVGAESTKPGAVAIDATEEWRRLGPVLERCARAGFKARISVDTYKTPTMRRALDAGVSIINDVKAAADPETLAVLGRQGATWLCMHMHSEPSHMQQSPLRAPAALAAVEAFYQDCTQRAAQAGLPAGHLWLDPGIGFGKTDSANLQLLERAFTDANTRSIVLGISRKSFMGRLLGIAEPAARDDASKMLEMAFLFAPITAIRTHDVAKLAKIRACLYAETHHISPMERS